jgi:hypothetical protein
MWACPEEDGQENLSFFAQKNQEFVVRTHIKAGAAESRVKAREQGNKGE